MKRVLAFLPNGKVAGPSKVPCELIKQLGLEVQRLLRKIFGSILRMGNTLIYGCTQEFIRLRNYVLGIEK